MHKEIEHMKVLLMVPLTSFMSRVPRFPDIGLGYIAAAVKKAGHDVYIKSWNMEPSAEAFKKYIIENRFDVIGIKVFTKDVAAANKTISVIKSTSSDTVVVVGGPHPSVSEPQDIFLDFPGCDFAIRGEAEMSLPLFINEISKKEAASFRGIHGLVWREGENVRFNAPFLSTDLDGFGMPLWELMPPKDYKAPRLPGGPKYGYSAPIILTRGCSSVCTYCSAHKVNGKRVRSRSAASVLEEITLLYEKYLVRHIFFLDTRFSHNIDVVKEICEGIIRNRWDIAWDCVGYEDMETLTEDALRLMKKAGCRCISMGIEAGSDRVRKLIKKQGTTHEILQKVKMIKDVGIGSQAFFMMGFPGETRKDMEEAADYAFSLPVDNLHFEIPCPHPGTEMLKRLKEKYGVKRIDWETFDIYKSPYPLSELDSSELYGMLRKIRRRCTFMSWKRRLSSLWS